MKKELKKNRLIFQMELCAFVVVLSFLYGLSVGLSRKAPQAHAFSPSFSGADILTDNSEEVTPVESLALIPELKLVPIGRDLEVNGRKSDAMMFYSNFAVPAIIEKQSLLWKSRGVQVFSKSSRNRGLAFGFDPLTESKYSIVSWIIPPSLQKHLSPEYRVQGFVAFSDGSLGDLDFDHRQGEIPEVPLIPGGRAGAVVSSNDRGGKSITGSYTNPGSVSDNISFYQTAFQGSGWREEDGAGKNGTVGFLRFRREERVADLLFTALPKRGSFTEQTVLLVTLSSGEGSTE